MLPTALALLVLPTAQTRAAAPLPEPFAERVERRANDFTRSSQNAVALDADGSRVVVVWHSRRQEQGTYGAYARLYDADGNALSGETRVNATTDGMQTDPVVALDDSGGIWFAWCSFGQDGDQGTVVARRFDERLETATHELVVNEVREGDQSEVALAALPGGGALVAWSSRAPEGTGGSIHARALAADGTPASDAVVVDGGLGGHLAALASDAQGQVVLAWARVDTDGHPAGVFARSLDARAHPLSDAQRVDPGREHAIEPVVATTPDGARTVVGWLAAEDEGYGIRLRALERGDQGLELEETRRVDVPGTGYTSGLALDLDADGRALLVWSRYADGPRGEPGVFARRFERKLSVGGATFRVTERSEGPQAITPASGSRRARLLPGGAVAVAWSGDGGLGDDSGAHLTLLLPRERDGHAAAVRSLRTAGSPHFDPPEDGASPHDPPTFDPSLVDRSRLDDGPPTTFLGGDLDFLGIANTGWTPPDPHMAVGPNHLVLMTNGAIAFFDHDGTFLFQDQIEGAGGFWGAQGATGFVFDPEVVWDPHSQRFMAMANERATDGDPYFLLAVSDDANPVGTWHRYRIDVAAEINDDDIDSPNIAVDDEVIYLTADFFGPDKFLVYMIEKAPTLSGGPINATSLVINGSQSMGVPVTYDADAPAQYMIEAFLFQDATQVRFYAITDPLTAPQVVTTTVTVPQYRHPEDPPQLGTSVRPETFEARFWSAVERNGSVWATHHGFPGRVRQIWYQFDMNDWPVGGTPTLVQSGSIDLGSPIRTYFGSLWVDEADNMGLVYARSSPDEFISIERTWRAASDPLGTTRAPVRVRDSTAADTSGRWGDYSAVADDPVDPDTFWALHEYTTGPWRTRVARWTIDTCATLERYCSPAVANSTGSPGVVQVEGSFVVADDDLTLVAEDLPPESNLGYFVMGQGMNAFTPLGSAGPLCVTPGLLRVLPPVSNTNELPGGFTRSVGTSGPQTGSITPGSTWNFQAWHRDLLAGTSNLTDALSVTFCP